MALELLELLNAEPLLCDQRHEVGVLGAHASLRHLQVLLRCKQVHGGGVEFLLEPLELAPEQFVFLVDLGHAMLEVQHLNGVHGVVRRGLSLHGVVASGAAQELQVAIPHLEELDLVTLVNLAVLE